MILRVIDYNGFINAIVNYITDVFEIIPRDFELMPFNIKHNSLIYRNKRLYPYNCLHALNKIVHIHNYPLVFCSEPELAALGFIQRSIFGKCFDQIVRTLKYWLPNVTHPYVSVEISILENYSVAKFDVQNDNKSTPTILNQCINNAKLEKKKDQDWGTSSNNHEINLPSSNQTTILKNDILIKTSFSNVIEDIHKSASVLTILDQLNCPQIVVNSDLYPTYILQYLYSKCSKWNVSQSFVIIYNYIDLMLYSDPVKIEVPKFVDSYIVDCPNTDILSDRQIKRISIVDKQIIQLGDQHIIMVRRRSSSRRRSPSPSTRTTSGGRRRRRRRSRSRTRSRSRSPSSSSSRTMVMTRRSGRRRSRSRSRSRSR